MIAIGGSIMHNLALELKSQGFTVSGSDDKIYDPARSRLELAGLLPTKEGWFPEKLHQYPDAVILGMHAKKDNPELKEAIRLNLPIFSFPDFVTQMTKMAGTRIVIAGSHGKTTTTSMILHVLKHLKIETDYLVGAQLEGFERMVRLRNASIAVFEGDEYLSSAIDSRYKFLHYRPNIAVITGIAWDHMNVFPTLQLYFDAFRQFTDSLPQNAVLIMYAGDEALRNLAADVRSDIRIVWYSAPEAGSDSRGTVFEDDGRVYRYPFFGRHNLENMAAALEVCTSLSISRHEFLSAMETFRGAAKRLEVVWDKPGFTVFSDFAHAPSKVAAAVKAVRGQYRGRYLISLLELHTYSSLNRNFVPQYKGVLQDADKAVVIYDPQAMQLKGMEPMDEATIRKAFDRNDLHVVNHPEDLTALFSTLPVQDTVWLIMSSGGMMGINVVDYISGR